MGLESRATTDSSTRVVIPDGHAGETVSSADQHHRLKRLGGLDSVMPTTADLVERSLREDVRREFDRRVDEQAARLAAGMRAGRLDSPSFGLGLELEAYAVDEAGRLGRVPDEVFDAPCERELGLHAVELNTDPSTFDGAGIADQAAQLERRFRRAQDAAEEVGLEIVLDAMPAVPPPEGSRTYFGTTCDRDGITVAENMTPSPRYYAIDTDLLGRANGEVRLSVPGADCAFPSLLFESLTNSVQPHVQVPDASSFPRYYNLALRTLGPVLALATNSPLLPYDLYDVADPRGLLEATPHELRVPVFEQAINHASEKVRVPPGLAATTDAFDRLVADATCAPFLREWVADGERATFADRFWELDHKRGTYWRWLRTVAGGQPVDGGDPWSIRLEYRPLPAQPTVAENVGLQCLVAGLVRGLAAADHPLARLERDAAERCFYAAVEDGLAADLAWVTVDGERTADRDRVYEEVFEYARRGLREQPISDATVATYLEPLEARWRDGMTPSRWKLDRVRARLEAGECFDDAVAGMQAEYRQRSANGEPLAEWPSPRRG